MVMLILFILHPFLWTPCSSWNLVWETLLWNTQPFFLLGESPLILMTLSKLSFPHSSINPFTTPSLRYKPQFIHLLTQRCGSKLKSYENATQPVSAGSLPNTILHRSFRSSKHYSNLWQAATTQFQEALTGGWESISAYLTLCRVTCVSGYSSFTRRWVCSWNIRAPCLTCLSMGN